MSVIVACQNCGKKFKARDDQMGKNILCTGCGVLIPTHALVANALPDEAADPWIFPRRKNRALPPQALPPRLPPRTMAPKPKKTEGEGTQPCDWRLQPENGAASRRFFLRIQPVERRRLRSLHVHSHQRAVDAVAKADVDRGGDVFAGDQRRRVGEKRSNT